MPDDGTFQWNPVGILVDSSDPNWLKHLEVLTRRLPQMEVYGVVSFCDSAVGVTLRSGWPTAVHWRDLIPTAVYDELWRNAYGKIRIVLDGLGVIGKGALNCYLHVLSDALMRHYAWDYLARTSRPALVLLPLNSELRKRVGVLYQSQSWLTRVVGGTRNLERLCSWLWGAVRRDGGHPANKHVSGILMIVEDGVSEVHKLPALAVARELARRGHLPRIVTSTPNIASCFARLGHSVGVVRPSSLAHYVWNALRQAVPDWLHIVRKTRQPILRDLLPPEFLAWLRISSLGYLLRRLLLIEAIQKADSTQTVEMVLALGETSPLAIVAFDWANHRSIPNAAIIPVLIGRRPDNEDFPASVHLVYGEQAADWMRGLGVVENSIRVVGSPNFETALERDRATDVRMTRSLLPNWRPSQRLVVLATEALPVPEIELGPILQACLTHADIYVVMKLHPVDPKDAFAPLIEGVETGRDRLTVWTFCDLEALLHAADLLVCVQSNIAITAAILGTPTLCPTFGSRERPVDLTTGGFATECATADNARELIDMLTRSGLHRQGALDRMRKGVAHFAGGVDGKSAVRIADAVLEFMGPQYRATTISR